MNCIPFLVAIRILLRLDKFRSCTFCFYLIPIIPMMKREKVENGPCPRGSDT